jgi:hypothetical protein
MWSICYTGKPDTRRNHYPSESISFYEALASIDLVRTAVVEESIGRGQ